MLEEQSGDYVLEIMWWRSVKMKFRSMKCCAVGVVLGLWTLTSFQNFCPWKTFSLKAYINEYWKKVEKDLPDSAVGYRCWRCGTCFDKCVMICLLHWNLSSVLRKVSKSPASCFERQSFLKIPWGQKKKKDKLLLHQKNPFWKPINMYICIYIYAHAYMS